MSFCDAGLAVLSSYYNQMLANEPGAVAGEDPEPLHDMRVATNRLREALRDFRPAFGRSEIDPLADDAHWLSGMLGKIRDLDVFVEWLKCYEQDARPEQRPYIRRIIQDREAARVRERAALLTGLRSPRYHEFTRAFSHLLRGHKETARCDQGALPELAASKIARHLKRVRRAEKRAAPGHFKRLHRLRIECKRLRYTEEFFSSLFPDHLTKAVKRAREVQDALGDLHDSHMHILFLQDMRRTQVSDRGMRNALDSMLRLLCRQQDHAYSRFQGEYQKLASKRARKKLKKRTARPL